MILCNISRNVFPEELNVLRSKNEICQIFRQSLITLNNEVKQRYIKRKTTFNKMLNNKGLQTDLCGIPPVTEAGNLFCILFLITEVISEQM